VTLSATKGKALAVVDQARIKANKQIDPKRKAELGQFMTPASVAAFMASLFTERRGAARLLDAGAGVGSLTAAFIDCWSGDEVRTTAFELDGALASTLRNTLASNGIRSADLIVIDRDFIREAVGRIERGQTGEGFTHAILNPPYKKINSKSQHRALLRAVGLETVNLYAAFVGLALELMSQGGEVVAIVPRSFCNGLYYRPFREWIYERAGKYTSVG
jgi:adenine-specific DNA-methyltransferase